MSATSKTFQVTVTSTGTAFDMSAENVILIAPSGSGARVLYDNGRGTNDIFVVTNTPLAISTASGYVIPVTSSSTTVYLNVDRIIDVIDSGSGAKVYFQQDIGGAPLSYTVTETRAAIRTLIAGVVGSGGSGEVVTGITARAGGGQASATALSYGYNEITVVATALDSVKLPAALVGAQVTVLNDGANIANIYGQTGATINDGAANSPVPIAPGVTLVFTAITSTNWESTAQVVAVPDGAVGAPSLTFEADADTGVYRIGANNIGVAANGAKVLDVATTGLGVTGLINVSTNQTFTKEANHSISVAATTTAATVGGALTVSAAAGNTTGKGGDIEIGAGAGGATGTGGDAYIHAGGGNATGDSGTMNVYTEANGAGSTGNVLINSGTAGAGTSGDIVVTTGTGTGGAGKISFAIAAVEDFSITANTLTAISGSTIATNTIAETTGGSGVTVDGLVIKDSTFQYNSTGFFGVTKAANTTLTIDETGLIFGNKVTALTLTLPATVVGYSYFIVNIDGSAVINVDPDAADYIAGAGLTKADNKDLIIPAVKGAYAQIIADGVNGWYIAQGSGTLTKEA